jgi:hypothetical protein
MKFQNHYVAKEYQAPNFSCRILVEERFQKEEAQVK